MRVAQIAEQHTFRYGIRKRTSCSREKKKVQESVTRAAEEATDRLEPPVLPEYLRGDDGPSGNEEENGAKRPRSTSTTPKSARGIDADEYDSKMGISVDI